MEISAVTPRDRLQKLVDLVRKTTRYWYMLAIFAVVGGGLSFVFANTRPRIYQSWATLFYQERIQSSVLTGRTEEVQRNIGDRYRELLNTHALLEPIVADPKINAYPELRDDTELKIDKLRLAMKFESRGANAFRITFQDSDPERAKAITEKLTASLQDTDEKVRNEQAEATLAFAKARSDEAQKALSAADLKLAEFLTKNPQFVADPNVSSEGAAIRQSNKQNGAKPVLPTGNSRLSILERERYRIQQRLDAPPDAPPQRVILPPTPEKIAAEQAVAEAQRELASAQRELDDALSKYTDKHPTVIAAQEKVAAATTKLRHAQASIPPDVEAPVITPATPEARIQLQKELASIESQISDEQRRAAGVGAGSGSAASVPTAATDTTSSIVKLETDHSELAREVAEARERASAASSALANAQLDESQKKSEQDRLTVVDPAFKPLTPSGPGKTIFLMAGMVLFIALGFALMIGLALLDDRVYRRAEIDELGLAVLAVIPPELSVKAGKSGRAPKNKKRATTQIVEGAA